MTNFSFTRLEEKRLERISAWLDATRVEVGRYEREKKKIRDRARMRFIRESAKEASNAKGSESQSTS